MRLTHAAHLRLPFGRLMGYEIQIGEAVGPLPLSFDQRRHVARGDRPGSWMALSFRLPEPVDLADFERAWHRVVARHGTLRTVVSAGADGPVLHEHEVATGRWIEHRIGHGQSVNDAVREVFDTRCTPHSSPSHHLCVLETAEGPTVLVAADHAHTDMWSMLVIARDLLDALGSPTLSTPPSDPPAFADHTRALRRRDPAPAHVHERWAEVIGRSGGVMPRFPLPLGDVETPQPERVEVRDVLDLERSTQLQSVAGDGGVSPLALVVGAMTEVTQTLAGTSLRVVFPVHSRYDTAWHDSVGWFITNSVLECEDPSPTAAKAAVVEAVRLGSWPLEELLAPWGGMPEAPGMFAVSWLDLRRLPVQIDSERLQAQYVSAATETSGVMLWFILNHTGLHLRCRYPDTLEARAGVGGWLDLLVARLRGVAAPSMAR